MIKMRITFSTHTTATPVASHRSLRLRLPVTTLRNAAPTMTNPSNPLAPEHADATLSWNSAALCVIENSEPSLVGTADATGITFRTTLSAWIVSPVN